MATLNHDMTLPAPLLRAIAQPVGGQVVLVIGAGTSFEPPTNLPLSSDCAQEVHRQLMADGILSNGDCADPSDLSGVADAVATRTGSQRDMVVRLPRERFRQAEPNEGHLLAAAMLYERALGCVMTLNFDLAMSSALVQVGAGGQVAIVGSPTDHDNIAITNLIYLHRNVDADPDEWVLRSTALDADWKDGWEQIIAQRVIGALVTVFVGLGTPAGVLVDSTQRIQTVLPATAQVYLVDPGAMANSAFFQSLQLLPPSYLRMGWVAFMQRLAGRLIEEQRAELERACNELIVAEGWDAGNVADVCGRLVAMGLIRLGRLRARWLLHAGAYLPRHTAQTPWLADLLLAVHLVERQTDSTAGFGGNGVVEFRRGDRILGSVGVAHGRGIRRWLSLEAEVKQSQWQWEEHHLGPRRVLVSGFVGDRPTSVAPPPDIVSSSDAGDIVTGESLVLLYSVDHLRQDPQIAAEILS